MPTIERNSNFGLNSLVVEYCNGCRENNAESTTNSVISDILQASQLIFFKFIMYTFEFNYLYLEDINFFKKFFKTTQNPF